MDIININFFILNIDSLSLCLLCLCYNSFIHFNNKIKCENNNTFLILLIPKIYMSCIYIYIYIYLYMD